ncbi:MAG: MORN repeat-containing protein, partial [Burkholderiales bacterium]
MTNKGIDRVFKQKVVNYHYMRKHASGIMAFFHWLKVEVFGPDQRDTKRTKAALILAKQIQEKILDANLPGDNESHQLELTQKFPDITVTYEKNSLTGLFEIVKYKSGWLAVERRVLLSFRDKTDPIYESLQLSTNLYLDDQLSLFGSKINNNQAVTTLAKSDLVIIIGGTGATSNFLKQHFLGIKQELPKDVMMFDGPNLTGKNMPRKLNEIYAQVEAKLNSLPKEKSDKKQRIITIRAYSRGCFLALELARKYPNVCFRLALHDPVKGPWDNSILKRNNSIPENVRICKLDYSGQTILRRIGDKSILFVENPNTTVLEVNIIEANNHSNSQGYTLDYLRAFNGTNKITAYRSPQSRDYVPAPNHHLIMQSYISNDKILKTNNKPEYKWPDGSYLIGTLIAQKWHGEGKKVYSNGSIYEGDFKFGKRQGQGTLLFPSGTRYVGDFKDNEFHGEGNLFIHKEFSYEGAFNQGRFHGQGKLNFSDGSSYEGEFRNDDIHGRGKFINANGDSYEGDFRHNKMHGKGKLIYANGDSYEGDFRHDKMHGKGKLIYANGDSYKGNFRHDKMHGK